jgi:hypothetical protein
MGYDFVVDAELACPVICKTDIYGSEFSTVSGSIISSPILQYPPWDIGFRTFIPFSTYCSCPLYKTNPRPKRTPGFFEIFDVIEEMRCKGCIRFDLNGNQFIPFSDYQIYLVSVSVSIKIQFGSLASIQT